MKKNETKDSPAPVRCARCGEMYLGFTGAGLCRGCAAGKGPVVIKAGGKPV